MSALLQKIKADITRRPLSSLLITLTIAASATLLTLALATLTNLNAPYDQSFEDLNAAHLWLYFDRDRVRRRDIAWIESLPGVVESTGLQRSVLNRVRVGDTRVWVSLRAIGSPPPVVNRLLVQNGREPAPHHPELLAGKEMNDLYRLAVGEAVGLTGADGKTVYWPVVGLAYNPMWDTYRNTQPPYLYLTEESLRQLYPDEDRWDWSLGLRLADPDGVDDMLARIEDGLRAGAVATHTDWQDVRESAIFGAQLNFALLGAFSFFAIAATVLVITGSISATVLSQFRQIGILKAIGFTQRQVVLVYVGQYLLLAVAGTTAGLVLGAALAPLPLKSIAVSLNAAYRPPLNAGLCALVLAIVLGVVVLSTLGAAIKGAQTNTLRAIVTGAEAPRRRTRWKAEFAARLGLPVTLTMGLNDLLTRPFRAALTGLNLTLGVMGIIFGLTLNSTLTAYIQNPALLGIVYDALVTRQETGHHRTERLLTTAPGVEAFYSQFVTGVKTPTGESFEIKAVAGDLTPFPFIIAQGRMFEPGTNEAIAGRGLLGWLGLRVGDELTVLVDDKPVTWRIVGQYPEPVNAGQMLMVSLPALAHTLRHASPTTYYLKLTPGASPEQLKRYLEPGPEADLNLTLVGDAIPDSIAYLQLGIFTLAAILIGIALVNVFNTSLQTVQEKLRVIGILKTVGMTPGQVVAMVVTAAAMLGLLAAALGIPLGWLATRWSLQAFAESYGFGQVAATLNYLYAALLLPLVVLVSMASSLIPGRRAAKAAIVSVLRHE